MREKKKRQLKEELEKFYSYLKNNGFIFATSKIYGGIINSWDIGPYGVMIKENIKKEWKSYFINKEHNNYLFDSMIFQSNKVWENSGHASKFNDDFIECKSCKKRYRVEDVVSNSSKKHTKDIEKNLEKIDCLKCGKNDWSEIRKFDLMFRVNSSKVNDDDYLYLRPETSQGIFVNFKNFTRNLNLRLPFGIAQIGKSFRNEVTPNNTIFKTREFEQLELEKFVLPKKAEENKWLNYLLKKTIIFLEDILKIAPSKIHTLEVKKSELAHYSKETIDIEFDFIFGRKEIAGLANRGNYDLKSHEKGSGENFKYLTKDNEKVLPSVIELSMGLDRILLAILSDCFTEELVSGNMVRTRTYFNFPYNVAPFKLAICPLTNKLHDEAFEIYQDLLNNSSIDSILYKETGTIGKRYLRFDELGVPFVVVYDYSSKEDGMVTVRFRNSTNQERIKIEDIEKFILENKDSEG